jgi:hypothetical protein
MALIVDFKCLNNGTHLPGMLAARWTHSLTLGQATNPMGNRPVNERVGSKGDIGEDSNSPHHHSPGSIVLHSIKQKR